MSDWRELAEIASDHIGYECRHTGTPDDSVPGLCSECWELGGKVADAILAAGYRKPLTIENDKLVIDDGLLLLEVGGCTCSPYGSSHEAGCGYEFLDDLTKPLERAGYRKPRTISTIAELDALPFESVIRDGDECILERWGDLEESGWVTVMVTSFVPRDQITLPATVLYEGARP